MNRYPDEIIILESTNVGPYKKTSWNKVYSGRCRCFLDRQSAFRTNKVMDCSYQVVIPDRYMPEIGENFKIGVKMHTNKSSRNWDLVGYVKDFARYDRVCNLYFQMVKENLIYDDVPGPVIDTTKRILNTYDDDYVSLESVGLVNDGILLSNEVLTIENKLYTEGYDMKILLQDDNGDWSEEEASFVLPVFGNFVKSYYDKETGEFVTGNKVYVLSAYYDPEPSEVRTQPNTIRIEVYHPEDQLVPVYAKELVIVEEE